MTVPYLLLLSLFLLSSFFIIINFMMCRFNEYAGFTWFSCHAGFVRLLLDGCYGRWFVYVKQRNATASCWALCAGGTCTLLRTSFVDRNTGRQSIRSGKYPICSDLSLRGKNMHSMKARFVLLILPPRTPDIIAHWQVAPPARPPSRWLPHIILTEPCCSFPDIPNMAWHNKKIF